ncbi:MAG: IS256 family transposase [Chloroflexota bacterium]|nr:IS256 family transposase [Chloroflexota bacterium]
MDRIAPSARLEAQIAELLTQGPAVDRERLAELGRLGARLVLQRAVDEEVAAFLSRARYQRTPAATGSRNGTRPKPIQTAEGEISIAMPQVRNTAERFVSQVIPDTKAVVRTRPLEALIIGSYVRGLSDRDIESLAKEAELGHVSKSTVSRICRELRDRYTAFCNKSLADISVMALFLDAIYLPTRPSGQKEGVLVAWGYTTEGKRVLLAVRLGQRESHEDWLDLGRDLTRRGLRSPWLVVSDGAPGLIKAIDELWPAADRGRCAVHKLRNVVAKLPKRPGLRDEIKDKYWAALDDATDPADAERRLRELVAELERPYPSAAACLAEDLSALCIHLNYFPRLRKRFRSSNLLERSLEEVRRRTKVIGRFPGETSCLSMCWAVLDLFLAGARGLGLSDLEYKQVGPMKIARSHPQQTVSKVA